MMQCLTYDDVLIRPNYSMILPKDTETSTYFTKKIPLKIPLVSAAMDSVTESAMSIVLANLGGIGVIHKNMPIDKQVEEVVKVKKSTPSSDAALIDDSKRLRVAASVGVGPNEFSRAKALIEANVDAIVVDTAHGHSKNVMEMVKKIRQFNVQIVAGNVATKEGCRDLIKLGVDAIKVGVGPGSICTTRIITGVGVPQLSAILDCASVCLKYKIPFIADGGIKYSGDIVKGLAAGASSIMIGSLLAGTDEAPGELVVSDGSKYKLYRGMGSLSAMKQGSKDRYQQADTSDQKLVPEGVEGRVPYKGEVTAIINQLVGGLRSGMGYIGAKNLKELRKFATFIQVSSASLVEGHPNVELVKNAPNYSK